MTTGIYCYYDNLRCEIIYIGKDSHIDRNKRHGEHYQKSNKDKQVINKNLQNDNKSGRYSYAVLEQGDFTDDELNQKEISWIAFFNPKFCFTKGGDGGSLPGDKNPRFDPCIKIRKRKRKDCKQGFAWVARLVGSEGEERFSSVNLLECMKLIEEFINSKRNVYGYKTYKVVGFVYGVDEINYRRDISGVNHPQFNPCIKIKKRKKKDYNQGFYWEATPSTPEKTIFISSVNLLECMKLVDEFINSEQNVYRYETFKVVGFIYGVDEINYRTYRTDISGANHPQFDPCIKIRKKYNEQCRQGFTWRARPSTLEKPITLQSVDLQKCIKKVKKFIDSERNVFGYDSYEVIYN